MRLCFFFLSLFVLCGCAGTKSVTTPVIEERIYHDTIRSIQQQRDSVYLHDSIYLSKVGDTVYLEKWHTTYAERIKYRDSVVVQRDTIPVEVPTTITKEVKYIPWYCKVLSVIGALTIILCILEIGWIWKTWKG